LIFSNLAGHSPKVCKMFLRRGCEDMQIIFCVGCLLCVKFYVRCFV
jgi:hypothetical protein